MAREPDVALSGLQTKLEPSSTGLFGKPSGPVASQPSLLSPVPTNLQAPSFGSSGGSQSVLVTSTTANQQTQQAAPNLFGKSSNVFGNISSQVLAGGNSGGSGLFGKGSPAQSNSSGPVQAGEAAAVEVSSIYTPLSDLTEAEKAAFKAKAFQLGKIPIRPPPKELIHG
ncbi:nucleoporin-like 2 [Plakobranchus ocellatus]|uniref:Nucleoporin-like 2 n=1 Tax=Plakobranchus ocellatus TaxID=259542 RepID=A0AAV4A5Y5_9GAST|nr:nucleoporin-like 2 [Plakobranchus ocellatus]